MRLRSLLVCLAVVFPTAFAQTPSAASLAASLRDLSVDAGEIYHVRDLRIARGDVNIFLTDGFLAFSAPIAGRPIAAIFTTAGTEAGDGEIIATPPTRGERASLAYFTKTPNLDEHFNDAAFLFTDDLQSEVLRHVAERENPKAPDQAQILAAKWNPVLRNIAGDVAVPLIGSLLNGDPAPQGLFYAVLAGRTLGPFDIIYDPRQAENSTIGRIAADSGRPRFEMWSSFTARKSPQSRPVQPFDIKSYRIDVTIEPNLKVAAVSKFRIEVGPSPLRALDLQISQLMHIAGASVNGVPAEVFSRESIRQSDVDDVGRFLAVAPAALTPGSTADVEVRDEGALIQSTGDDVYFVEARNIWFPHRPADSATFDLTFHSPERLHVVSSGRLIDEKVEGSSRVVHRVLDSPSRFVGFNVGDFIGVQHTDSPFHIECFANRALADKMRAGPNLIQIMPGPPGHSSVQVPNSAPPTPQSDPLEELAKRTGTILREFLTRWGPLTTTNIAITPIPGTFGQGFPGLIYLSTTSFLPEILRPPGVRNPFSDIFYSDILLPHEIAHQWWGNLVVPSDYRSGWLAEALANYSAWQLFQKEHGLSKAAKILNLYTTELKSATRNEKPVEGIGPLDLGMRLRLSYDPEVWRIITYDKGTWVIRMLQQRLGEDSFQKLLRALAAEYTSQTLSNEEFRKAALRFLPKDDPDPSLEMFFDNWVYSTGIPRLALTRDPSQGPNRSQGSGTSYTLTVSGVPAEYTVDVPVTIQAPGKPPKRKWVRAATGATSFVIPSSTAAARVSLPAPAEFLYFPAL
jgi:Peptidase family M1 domain